MATPHLRASGSLAIGRPSTLDVSRNRGEPHEGVSPVEAESSRRNREARPIVSSEPSRGRPRPGGPAGLEEPDDPVPDPRGNGATRGSAGRAARSGRRSGSRRSTDPGLPSPLRIGLSQAGEIPGPAAEQGQAVEMAAVLGREGADEPGLPPRDEAVPPLDRAEAREERIDDPELAPGPFHLVAVDLAGEMRPTDKVAAVVRAPALRSTGRCAGCWAGTRSGCWCRSRSARERPRCPWAARNCDR